jgi:hypothetical protein
MPFEQMLRDRLLDEAESVPLPHRDAGRAIARARAHRHRRTAAVGVTAAVAVTAAAVSLVQQGGTPGDPVVIPSADELPRTGPPDLAWQATAGGLSGIVSEFQQSDGTVYALSTGPGVRYDDFPEGDLPKSLYALGADGTWREIPLEGDRPRLIQATGADGLLYGVGTGPAADGGRVARLLTSGDGGDTWDGEEIALPDPPSTGHGWKRSFTMEVESTDTTTLALVRTSYFPDVAALFPETDTMDGGYTVEFRDEGLVLVRLDPDGIPTPPTVRPSGEAEDGGARDLVAEPPGDDLRTVPWSDLGVTGPRDVASVTQLFRRSGDAWEPLSLDVPELADRWFGLSAAGGTFVITEADTTPHTFTSPDGSAWTAIDAPGDYVVAVGSALVAYDGSESSLQVSNDAGGTWSEVDLQAEGVPDGAYLGDISSGPLGLAMLVYGEQGPAESLLVSSDLVDWTLTPLADVVGVDDVSMADVFVGADRIVVSAVREGVPPGPSITAVGTPRRG